MEKRTVVLSDPRVWLACAAMVALGALGCSSSSSPATDAAAQNDSGGAGGTATASSGAGGTTTPTSGAGGTTTATSGRGGTASTAGGAGGTVVRDAAVDLREDAPARDAVADLSTEAQGGNIDTGGAAGDTGNRDGTTETATPDVATAADGLDAGECIGLGGIPAGGGVNYQPCCPNTPPDCSDKPDFYPGYLCVPAPQSYCGCACQSGRWECAC